MKPLHLISLIAIVLAANSAGSTDFKCDTSGPKLSSGPAALSLETALGNVGPDRRAGQPPFPKSNAQLMALAQHHSGMSSGLHAILDDAAPLGHKSAFPKLKTDDWPVPPQVLPPALLQAQATPAKSSIIERVISPDDAISAGDLNRPAKTQNFKILQTAYMGPSACSVNDTVDWFNMDADVRARSTLGVTSIVQTYLADPAAFAIKYDPEFAAVLKKYVPLTRDILSRCFIPAEQSNFELKHRVLRQMGRILDRHEPICTATLVGNDHYLITARHCFKGAVGDASHAADLWFQPTGSSHRYQLCAIAEDAALAEDRFNSIEFDQVLVRTAPTAIQPQPMRALPAASLSTTRDESEGVANAPTLLTNISFFPTAQLLDPQRFVSGYVQVNTKVCAAIAKTSACFSHFCSVIEGGSGSPLFVSDADDIVLAGTHVGADADSGQQCRQDTGSMSNSALMIRSDAAQTAFLTPTH